MVKAFGLSAVRLISFHSGIWPMCSFLRDPLSTSEMGTNMSLRSRFSGYIIYIAHGYKNGCKRTFLSLPFSVKQIDGKPVEKICIIIWVCPSLKNKLS